MLRTARETTVQRSKDEADRLVRLGIKIYQRGDIQEAFKLFTKAIRVDGKCAMAYEYRAALIESQGKLEEALIDAEKACSVNPQYSRGYLRRGKILRLMHKYDDAAKVYQCALKSIRQSDPFYVQLNEQLAKTQAALTARQQKPFIHSLPALVIVRLCRFLPNDVLVRLVPCLKLERVDAIMRSRWLTIEQLAIFKKYAGRTNDCCVLIDSQATAARLIGLKVMSLHAIYFGNREKIDPFVLQKLRGLRLKSLTIDSTACFDETAMKALLSSNMLTDLEIRLSDGLIETVLDWLPNSNQALTNMRFSSLAHLDSIANGGYNLISCHRLKYLDSWSKIPTKMRLGGWNYGDFCFLTLDSLQTNLETIIVYNLLDFNYLRVENHPNLGTLSLVAPNIKNFSLARQVMLKLTQLDLILLDDHNPSWTLQNILPSNTNLRVLHIIAPGASGGINDSLELIGNLNKLHQLYLELPVIDRDMLKKLIVKLSKTLVSLVIHGRQISRDTSLAHWIRTNFPFIDYSAQWPRHKYGDCQGCTLLMNSAVLN